MCPSVNCNLTAPMGEISTFGSGSVIVVLSPNIHRPCDMPCNTLVWIRQNCGSRVVVVVIAAAIAKT